MQPSCRHSSVSMRSSQQTAQIAILAIIGCGVLSGVGAIWDTIWWHRYIGRHAFWIPPHACVVIGSGIGICIALYLWFCHREKIWRAFSLCFLCVIATQPIDNIWHIIFGVEDPSTIWIYWSPPHLLIVVSMIGFWFLARAAARKLFVGTLRAVLVSLSWAFVLSAVLLEMRPLQPVGSIYQLLGFWGAGVIACVFISILLLIQALEKEKGVCQRVVLGYFCIHAIVALSAAWMFLVNPEISISVLWKTFFGGYIAIPVWMQMCGLFGVAIWLDYSTKLSLLMRTTVAGGMYGIIYFAFSSPFLSLEYQFSSTQAMEAIVAALIGGIAVSAIYSLYRYFQDEKRLSHN